jgi:hypothetical protein
MNDLPKHVIVSKYLVLTQSNKNIIYFEMRLKIMQIISILYEFRKRNFCHQNYRNYYLNVIELDVSKNIFWYFIDRCIIYSLISKGECPKSPWLSPNNMGIIG